MLPRHLSASSGRSGSQAQRNQILRTSTHNHCLLRTATTALMMAFWRSSTPESYEDIETNDSRGLTLAEDTVEFDIAVGASTVWLLLAPSDCFQVATSIAKKTSRIGLGSSGNLLFTSSAWSTPEQTNYFAEHLKPPVAAANILPNARLAVHKVARKGITEDNPIPPFSKRSERSKAIDEPTSTSLQRVSTSNLTRF